MKNCPSVCRTALTTITATAVCAGVCLWAANAQGNSTTNPAGSSTVAASAVSAYNALPYGAQEVVKMHQGGINKEIILSYIKNSAFPYPFSAANLAYLQSAGIPQDVTQAMIQRDGELREQQALQEKLAQAPVAGANGAVTPPTPAEGVTPPTPPPVVLTGPDYGYDYPDYDYDLYGPPIIVGGGWGWGYHGWHGGIWGHHGGGFHGGGFHGGFHGGGRGGGGHR